MKVLKFGGTSVGSPERMHHVAQLIQGGTPNFVVLSAVSGTTNALVAIGQDLQQGLQEVAEDKIAALFKKYKQFVNDLYSEDLSKQQGEEVIDRQFRWMLNLAQTPFTGVSERELLAQGELLSTQLFQIYLLEIGVRSVLLSALDFMRVDEDHEPAFDLIGEKLNALMAQSPDQEIYLTQGYICRNHRDEIDNLQRGGSDYTASILGAVLRSEEVQIWTDIDGMHNNDPRIVDRTYPVAELSFDEAAELAYFGAKILHPLSIRPAQRFGVPVKLLNTMQPDAQGTTIADHSPTGQIKAVAAKDGITAIRIKSSRMLLAYGFLRRVFEVFERYRTPIDMITTSEIAVSVTIDDSSHLDEIVKALEPFGTVEADRDHTIVCIVGNRLSENSDNAYRVMSALKGIPVRMISYGGSRHNISVLVQSKYKEAALRALNEKVFDLLPQE
ncbi:aspartate kinase [Catalinimonas alkaloidigena]|uniref:Aspartokinase n=1 Tax=Catalinimonas alkaloidigena TaxID=1075417 RepID=A0A1G9F8E6_9BACT|nr:aspartate kinase [Catalinimonas alkaloidigena]SDK84674.1 aspartate kinase [Catalinimonas alkaloidigena]